jgi:hypothetical protein
MFYQPWIKKWVVICKVIHIMPPVDTSYSVLSHLRSLFYYSHFKTSYKAVIIYVIICDYVCDYVCDYICDYVCDYNVIIYVIMYVIIM